MRRSLFTSEGERAKFLNHLAAGTRDILRTQRGLAEHANYHEFCRLLGRLKTNYQLSELVRHSSPPHMSDASTSCLSWCNDSRSPALVGACVMQPVHGWCWKGIESAAIWLKPPSEVVLHDWSCIWQTDNCGPEVIDGVAT